PLGNRKAKYKTISFPYDGEALERHHVDLSASGRRHRVHFTSRISPPKTGVSHP
ncbi:hypothetical protein HETIRDRAFT_479355, partial [Heterobasidion irregulare TC 32-1]